MIKIASIIEKTSAKGKKYLIVTGEENGVVKQFVCTDPDTQAKVKESIDKELDLRTSASQDGTATFVWLKTEGRAGGFGGSGAKREAPKNESFAASYSKDIAVAMVAAGLAKDSKVIDAIIEHYFSLFMGKLEKSAPEGSKSW